MFLSAAILIAAYAFIASEKISKVTVALIGACIVIITGLLSTQKNLASGEINPLFYVNFIDFNVIFLLIGMMLIVAISAKSGIFEWLAQKLVALARGRPAGILAILGIFTGVLSSMLDNVTTVILVMPITFSICEKLKTTPVPFLLAEIFASNIGGTATLIGDPPNIIIASAGNLSFFDFVENLTTVVLLILVVTIFLMTILFRKDLRADAKLIAELAAQKGTSVKLNVPAAIRALCVLFLVVVCFVFQNEIGIPASITALSAAAFLMIFERPEALFKDLEWNTIFFFIGLFIIVGALEASGAIKVMADSMIEFTGGSQRETSMIILWGSGIISGIIDNIPYTATMSPLISEIEHELGRAYAYPLWWSLSLGACLGGNMTIIGAAANVIVSSTAAKREIYISFWRFFAYGFLITMVSLIISTCFVLFRFF